MNRHSKIVSLLEITVGIIIGLIAVVYLTRDKIAFENLALGKGTMSYFAENDGYPIHLSQIKQPEINKLIEGWKLRGERDVLFVLGNSQTHGINQLKSTDETYNHLLFADYNRDSIDVITQSMPNVNLQEFLLIFDYWRRILPIKRLMLPLFMDDLREDGIREYYFAYLNEIDFQIEANDAIAQSINANVSEFTQLTNGDDEIDPDLKGLDLTVQQESETSLNDYLNTNFQTWDNRPTLRGKIFNNLYLLRNTVLGINAHTKRRMIASRLDKNMESLKLILEISKQDDIQVLLYIPPLRNDIEPPYDPKEYTQVKKQFQSISASYENVTYINLEGIVPGKYWGMKESTSLFGDLEPDFMHFQYAGHKLLYEKLSTALNDVSKR